MISLLKQAALVLAMTLPAAAHDGVQITDPYARVMVGNGSVYFMMSNHAAAGDVLLSAASPDAEMVHLMNSSADANGVMQMENVDGGFAVEAEGSRTLAGGGDHVMLMGMTRKVAPGDTVTLVLQFERAGEVTLQVPVDNKRTAAPGPGPTAFDARATASHEDHAAAEPEAHAAHAAAAPADHAAHAAAAPADHADHAAHMGAMSMPVGPDAEMIVATMKALFDKPDQPLTVDPVVVSGDSAIASWAQGDAAGRALLARRDGQWQIVLCGGPDLRSPEFLTMHGVAGAEDLSRMFNLAEDKLGSAAVRRYSSFQGIMMVSGPGHD
jgi:copper(I)-binding protein